MKRPRILLTALLVLLTATLWIPVAFARENPHQGARSGQSEAQSINESSSAGTEASSAASSSSTASSSSSSAPTESSSTESSVPYEESTSLPEESSLPVSVPLEEQVSIDWGQTSQVISYAPSKIYTLTVRAGNGGSVNGDVNGSYAAGDQVTLSAEAKDGYVFSRWNADAGVLANAFSANTEFYMPVGNAEVEAVFVKASEASASGMSEDISTKVTAVTSFYFPVKLTISLIVLLLYTLGLTLILVSVYRRNKAGAADTADMAEPEMTEDEPDDELL